MAKALVLFVANPRYPSLHVKKMEGAPDIWELRVSIHYRITFQFVQEGVLLRRVGTLDPSSSEACNFVGGEKASTGNAVRVCRGDGSRPPQENHLKPILEDDPDRTMQRAPLNARHSQKSSRARARANEDGGFPISTLSIRGAGSQFRHHLTFPLP
ncbi:MAG: hypothetical protein HY360_11900, partial [Verrucomicrobia bacterium]|nr:hypothetical protein [Verrucomicrobiota bacterium]